MLAIQLAGCVEMVPIKNFIFFHEHEHNFSIVQVHMTLAMTTLKAPDINVLQARGTL